MAKPEQMPIQKPSTVYSFPTVVVIDPNSERILAKESGFAPGTTAKTFLEHFDAKVKSSK